VSGQALQRKPRMTINWLLPKDGYLPRIGCCPLCGWVLTQNNGLCRYCWTYCLEHRLAYGERVRPFAGFSTRVLWDWGGANDVGVRRLILSLKNGSGRPALWDQLASALSAQALAPEGSDSKWVIVPCPPRKPGTMDHAVRLAHQLGLKLGLPVIHSLVRKDSGKKQRSLGRLERQIRSEQSLFSTVDERNIYRDVLFVDDVVTTGATAQAAWVCLGRPRRFQVWALARRLPCR
ncbi:MAG: hypothetical protein KDD43_05670, partial [Bdellovibrionales bacterium]|nr:hypothetical protein [Bdellovibrionales bacterium]